MKRKIKLLLLLKESVADDENSSWAREIETKYSKFERCLHVERMNSSDSGL